MNDEPKALRQANERSGLGAIAPYSARASAVTAAKMLDLAREMLLVSEDLSQRQSDFWIFELSLYPAHLIEKAWHSWVRGNKFMPVPGEIIAILEKLSEADVAERRLREDAARLAEEREIREQLKAAGEPYGLDQYRNLMKEALERVKSIPSPPDPNRRIELKQRIARH